MTEQLQDSCDFDGRRWAIEQWHGAIDCIPSNDQLNLRTIWPATNNWRGRVDHYLIHRRHLHLFKIEVSLNPKRRPSAPYGVSRREINYRFEPIEVHDERGTRAEIRRWRYDIYVYDDLVVPFTGKMRLSRPYFDYWEAPWPLDDDDEKVIEETLLLFENGLLISYNAADEKNKN